MQEPGYLRELEQVQNSAEQLLAEGDAEDALIILRVLLEEMVEDYDSDMDSKGYVAGFIQGLGSSLAEAILSAAMDDTARQNQGITPAVR